MVRLCGAALGLFAFAIAILQGLLVNNPTETTLIRAVQAMFAFCVIGLCVGWVAQRILDEHAIRRNNEMFKVIDEEEEEARQGAQAAAPAGGASAAGTQPKPAAPQPVAGT
jgi:hypothetical protein